MFRTRGRAANIRRLTKSECPHRIKQLIPKTGQPKNNFRKSGVFSAAKKLPSTHHVSPPNHHNFTTKKPHPTTAFPQKPQQKTKKTTTNKKPVRLGAG
jgi:hypothetical protein